MAEKMMISGEELTLFNANIEGKGVIVPGYVNLLYSSDGEALEFECHSCNSTLYLDTYDNTFTESDHSGGYGCSGEYCEDCDTEFCSGDC